MTEAIRTEHLKFSYDAQSESGGVMVFDDLNLSIEEGSFIAVLGHNGCGKSTLAKHFNAVLLPEGGSVQVFGMDTSDESLLVDIRRTVGMVFQNPDNQMVANVVEEDVAFAPENLGVPSEEIRRRVDEALKLVGMYDYRLHAPHLLSGGQKQRVAIAGVIAMRPLVKYLATNSAVLRQATTSMKSVLFSPLWDLKSRSTASEKLVTGVELAVLRSSGSRVKRPMIKILFSICVPPLLVLADDHGTHNALGNAHCILVEIYTLFLII